MDAKFFAPPPLEWFVDAKTLESCLLGTNILDKNISLTNLDACRDIHCEIVNCDGKLVFGVMVAPDNFVEATMCKLYNDDNALMLMLYAAVAQYDVKKLIRNVDVNMYKIVEDVVRTTDQLINNYSSDNFRKVGKHSDIARVKGTSILKLPDGKFIDFRNTPGVSYEKTIDAKVTDVHEYKLVYMRDKNIYNIYAVIGTDAYQLGGIYIYEKIYDYASEFFRGTKNISESKRWKMADIKKLITPICDLPKDELKAFVTPGMEKSDIKCTIKLVDTKNECVQLSFNNGERIVVKIPGFMSSDFANIEFLNSPLCVARCYVTDDSLCLNVGDVNYCVESGDCLALFEIILCLHDHYLKNVAKDIINTKFEFPYAPINAKVSNSYNTFIYEYKSMSINLDPGTEILKLLQQRRTYRSNIKVPNIKWFVAKNDDQHYLAVDIDGNLARTYELSECYAKLIHVWLNLCD